MAEGTVVKELLTESMIEAGAALTRRLDARGVPITAALWFFDPEVNEWRLLFASPDVDRKGRRAVYMDIGAAIDELAGQSAAVPLSVVSLLDSHNDLLRRLKAAPAAGPGLHGLRLSKEVLDGRFIDDALIYRAA